MSVEFEDARSNVPHRGEAGGEGETILRDFLNNHLPGRFRATSGFIIDKTDQVSGHVDVILYDALNCPVYRTSDRGMIIPNDNVAAVFEVKFQLTTTTLDDALDKIHETKNLVKTPHTPPHPQAQQIATFGVIFAFESKLEHMTVVNHWHAKLTQQNPLHNSCSMIVIIDRGIFVTTMFTAEHGVSVVDLQGISPAAAGITVGIGHLQSGDGTLDYMIRVLLGHLAFFRHRIDHPGFQFETFGPQAVTWIGQYTDPTTIEYKTPSGVCWLARR